MHQSFVYAIVFTSIHLEHDDLAKNSRINFYSSKEYIEEGKNIRTIGKTIEVNNFTKPQHQQWMK